MVPQGPDFPCWKGSRAKRRQEQAFAKAEEYVEIGKVKHGTLSNSTYLFKVELIKGLEAAKIDLATWPDFFFFFFQAVQI